MPKLKCINMYYTHKKTPKPTHAHTQKKPQEMPPTPPIVKYQHGTPCSLQLKTKIGTKWKWICVVSSISGKS